jgi:hypothetical protein
MTQKDIIKVLENIQNKIEATGDEKSREILFVLYNLIEEIFSDNTKLRKKNQTLKDEINNLKGEQGKPVIKPTVEKKMVIFHQKTNEKPPRHQMMRAIRKLSN